MVTSMMIGYNDQDISLDPWTHKIHTAAELDMIPKIPFGSTGHNSTRMLFGAAALGGMNQDKADEVLELLLEFGVNHIDVAAAYGDAELRLAPWLKTHRDDFFLATKTAERSGKGARRD